MEKRLVQRTRGVQMAELGGVLGFWTLVGTLTVRVARFADEAADWITIGAAGIAGYLFADFLSGVFHWGGDTLGDERTPILGPSIIATFREHHGDPKAITRHGFLEINGATCFASVPLLGATAIAVPSPARIGLFVIAFLVSSGLFGFATNQFHKWAHADSVPAVVRWLQKTGVILSPERHARHHTPPHDGHYCITAGLLSEPIERIRFFRRLEGVIARFAPRLLRAELRPARFDEETA